MIVKDNKSVLGTIAFALMFASQLFSQNLDSGLVLYYPFNGNTLDSTGNQYHGSVNSATLDSNRFGKPQGAFYFDGKDDYIAITGSKDVLYEYAVAVWFRTSTLNWGSTWKAGIIFSGNRAGSNRLGKPNIHLEEDGSIRVTGGYPGGSGPYPEIVKTGNYGDGKWHLVVANFIDSNNVFEFYLDGKFVGADTSLTRPLYLENLGTKNNMVTLGWRNGNNQFYEGNIDDLRIYNRRLNAADVKHLFLEGTCTDTYSSDTLQIRVADSTYKTWSSNTYLAKRDVFKTPLGCDSILELYHQFTYVPVICTDSVTLFDTIVVNDTVVVFDTLLVIDTLRISVTDTLIIDLQTVGLNQNQRNILKAFPNPTTGELVIDNGNYTLMDKYQIKVITSTGQTVFENEIDQQQFMIDLNQFGGVGLYFLQVYNPKNELMESRKIVLQ